MGTTPLEIKIEHGIKPLVIALNKVSYIQTVSSCEGHPDQDLIDRYQMNKNPNVVFNLETRYEGEFERLTNRILSRTQNLWQEVLTDVVKRYWNSADNKLQHNWRIDFRPFNSKISPHSKMRLYQMVIKEATEAVEDYASRYKK